MTRKFSFLSLFFIVLGATLAVAIVLRVQAYHASAAVTESRETSATEAPSSSNPRHPSANVASNDAIVPVVNAGETTTPSTMTTQERIAQAAKEREQRYNQLLREGAPQASASGASNRNTGGPTESENAATPKKESLLSRVVSPIANALGISKPTTTQPSNTGRPNQNQNQQPQPKPDPTEPPDPNSDVKPPQLLTVEFQPNVVKDNETTTLITQVIDDLSGVQTVSGVIASPTGALQGFACQREGETQRYVAQVKVPQDAAEGIWKINYLTLSDNARNSINLSAAQGMLPPTAQFQVTSSNSDATGPTLKAVWVDRPAMKAGERNVVFVQAEDEKSGVKSVSGVLLSPSKNARLGFGCQLNAGSGVYECAVTPPTCLDCGIWSLEQIQVQDNASNMTNFRADNALVRAVHLDISADQCDAQPPEIASLMLEPLAVSNQEANTIVARVAANDDMCGVANLSGQAQGPGPPATAPRLYFSFERQGDQWLAKITVPKHAARGVWKIVWIQVLDTGHNLRAYGERDAALQGVTFRVN